MSVKQGFDQHQLLHAHWPSDCCLCKYEKEVKRLRIVADQLMFALGRHEATIATLRNAVRELAHGKHSGRDFANKILSETNPEALATAERKAVTND